MSNQTLERSATSLISERAWRRFLNDVWCELANDKVLYCILGAYYVVACALAFAANKPDRLVPFLYFSSWVSGLLGSVGVYLLLYEFPRAVRNNPQRPLAFFCAAVLRLPLERLIAGMVLFCCMAVFYGCFTSIKNILPALSPFWADRLFADIDAALHGGRDPWGLIHIAGVPSVTRVFEFLYLVPWGVLLYGGPALIAMHPRLSHLRIRFFLTLFLAWGLLGNVVAGLFLSAGPVFYGYVTEDFNRFASLVSSLSSSNGLPYSAFTLQQDLWAVHMADKVEFGTGISAFPSMHVASVALWTLVGWQIDRRLGVAMLLLWLAILVGSVYLGWHYAVDGYFSTLVTVALWLVVGRLLGRQSIYGARN